MTTVDPGGIRPPNLVVMQQTIMERAPDHGLAGLKFAGIFPGHPRAYGYHNSRIRHTSGFSDRGASDYSVQLPLDRGGDERHFSAIDIANTNAHTRIITRRLADAVAMNDSRARYMREFYGSLDNVVVFGQTHNRLAGAWVPSSADNSHLWHVHISFFRTYANDPEALAGVAEIVLGIPAGGIPPPSEPDLVRALIEELQRVLGGLK